MSLFEHSSGNTGTVALIDDNDDVRSMLALALETAGFDVFASRTEFALQRWLAHNRPDALIIDLRQPEAEGLELVRRLRARRPLARVPILFLSNSVAEDFRFEVIRAGADWFGLRPIGILDLQTHVTELIEHGRPIVLRVALAAGRLQRLYLRRTG
jgi:DNA-binding response OmpR family regulator